MKPPRLLADLYADLRDRKLLPLVGVLLVAMVAVPMFLKTDPEPPPPATDVSTEVPEGVPVPAVLASNPGLRDYRERLHALHSKNPFAGEKPKGEGSAAEAQVAAVTEAAEDAGLTDIGGSGGDGGSSSASATEASTSTATDTTVVEETGGGGGGSKPDVVELAFRVDVEVGPAGDVHRRKNVKLLTVLPSQSNPVMLYLGASEDGSHAVFLVSDDVVTVRGDGRCLPTPADCQFLNMKKGDEMRFEYAPGGGDADTFVLRVLDISLKRNDETADSDKRDADSAQSSLRAWLGL